MVQVRFVGGPFDGQTNEISGTIETNAVIYWPQGASPGEADDEVPGDDDVTEYIYAGDGTAHYVGGLIDEDSAGGT
ncbi:MAG: hypothetical protein ACRDHI_09765 [Actinomycetota bacterium]